MLHYKGLISQEPGIKVEPVGSRANDFMETLMFYDDELCDEKSCFLVQEQLQEHFKSESNDVFIQVHYDKEDDRVIIGMTIFFDKKEDRSKLFTKYKSGFEKFYNETFFYPKKV